MKIIALKTITGSITKDKEYEVISFQNEKAKILDDDGYEFQLSKDWFCQVEQEISLLEELNEVFSILNPDDELTDVINSIIYDIANEAFEAGKNGNNDYITKLFKGYEE